MPEPVAITLPAMGESVGEGTVSRWLKAVGDAVVEGESVVEISTDKVDMEVPAPVTGILGEISAPAGATIPVGSTLGLISPGNGETITPFRSQPETREDAGGEGLPARPPDVSAPPATPLARRAALHTGRDLRTVSGSGPGGIVRKSDLSPTPAAPALDESNNLQTLTGPYAALAEHMEQSREIPTATSVRTIPAGQMELRREQLNSARQARGVAGKISFTHLIAFALVQAAGEHPEMCAAFVRDESGKPGRMRKPVNLGLAIDTRRPDGGRFLVVPVIKDAAKMGFAQFHREYERLVSLARENRLHPADLEGAAITLTNPGAIGTMMSIPRLMPGQGTIVATGAIALPPEWRHSDTARRRELGISKVMTITSTYDHRVIQGAQSGEFLRRIEELLAGDSLYRRIFAELELAWPEEPVAKQTPAAAPAPESDGRQSLAAMEAASTLVRTIRSHGHMAAHLDPLGLNQPAEAELDPAAYGLTPDVMRTLPAGPLGLYVTGDSVADVVPKLQALYCGTVAYEFEHLNSAEQRRWLYRSVESGDYKLHSTPEFQRHLLSRLTRVEAMERYLRRTFLGQKTFSIEGVDSMVPMLEQLLTLAAEGGVEEVVLGMAHRGRLATICHVVNHPYESVLSVFEGKRKPLAGVETSDPTGDVKYHLGATGTYVTGEGKAITVRLLPNPSHLEAIDPVVEGWARARQTVRRGPEAAYRTAQAIPVLIHGDAAFSGQGVVAEVLNLRALAGYATGGTLHLIADNQIGFTTDPQDGRSTRYASDIAKGFDIPVIHVNADDVLACVNAMRLAYDFRREFATDIVVDLVGYRRFGHNETDEPAYTQPVMYQRIKAHSPVRELLLGKLAEEGIVNQAEAEAEFNSAYARVAAAHKRVKETLAGGPADTAHMQPPVEPEDQPQLSAGVLTALHEELISAPEGFAVNGKLQAQLRKRHAALQDSAIDWGTVEALAFASLLCRGVAIRLTGQDTERGTFSHRHLVLHDEVTGGSYVPLQHLRQATGTFEIHNSPLSEVACLGFEYGYSAADPGTLVLWEAQFGDFINNAQMVVDQFIASGFAKWGQRSRLVLLLPHGYEGNGPEHSSARIERLLQLVADDNLRVANCSTPAQYFHLLIGQALNPKPRPLAVLTPKSLLRLPAAGSALNDLTGGRFAAVIDDPAVAAGERKGISRLLLCSGKIYYDLQAGLQATGRRGLAIARLELLAPLPVAEIQELIAGYPHLQEVVWVQEEPENMGAWSYVRDRLDRLGRPLLYVGRSERASPSEGYAGSHATEQDRIVSTALGLDRGARERR